MVQSHRDRLSRTAMSLAVLSVFSLLTFPVVAPYMLGSLAIVFAIISKGGSERFTRNSKTAFVLGIVAIAANTALIISSFLYINKVINDPELQQQFSETMYKMYGFTFEEFLQQFGR